MSLNPHEVTRPALIGDVGFHRMQDPHFWVTTFRVPYNGVFKPYSDVLKPYSGVFLQNFFISVFAPFREPYSGVLKPYSDVLKPYSGVLELDFPKIEFYAFFNF